MEGNRTAKDEWIYWLLVFVLSVAAGTRFYLLGNDGFNAQDLFNISFCSIDGLFARSHEFFSRTGLPFLYPTLLCQFVDPTNKVDFFVNAFSAIAGIGIVWAVYLVGARFFSPLTGALAAALIAVDFHSIALSQSITPYGFFAFLCLIHAYFFCGMFCDTRSEGAPFSVSLSKENFTFNFSYSIKIKIEVIDWIGFLCSAFFSFYINPIFILFFLIETIVAYWFVGKESRRSVFLLCFLPVFVATIPWFVLWSDAVVWALHYGHVVWGGLDVGWLLNMPLGYMGAMAFLVGITMVVAMGFIARNKVHKTKEIAFLVFSLMAGAVPCLVLSFTKMVDPRSFAASAILLSVPLGYVASTAFGLLRNSRVKKIAVFVSVIVVMCSFVLKNNKERLYAYGSERGFEWAAKIVAGDKRFMSGDREVIVSTPLFNYYLYKYDVVKKNVIPEEQIDSVINAMHSSDFYYLEYVRRGSDLADKSVALQKISSRFKEVCSAYKKQFHVFKFTDRDIGGSASSSNCSENINELENLP